MHTFLLLSDHFSRGRRSHIIDKSHYNVTVFPVWPHCVWFILLLISQDVDFLLKKSQKCCFREVHQSLCLTILFKNSFSISIILTITSQTCLVLHIIRNDNIWVYCLTQIKMDLHALFQIKSIFLCFQEYKIFLQFYAHLFLISQNCKISNEFLSYFWNFSNMYFLKLSRISYYSLLIS